jgi:hypothetical protein
VPFPACCTPIACLDRDPSRLRAAEFPDLFEDVPFRAPASDDSDDEPSGDGNETQLPPRPPPLRKPPDTLPKRSQKFKTQAQLDAAWAVYNTGIAARSAAMAARRRAQTQDRMKRMRHADPARANETRTRQRRAAPHRMLSIARGLCCPDHVLGLRKEALDNSRPFHVGVLGSCRACHAVSCSCVRVHPLRRLAFPCGGQGKQDPGSLQHQVARREGHASTPEVSAVPRSSSTAVVYAACPW